MIRIFLLHTILLINLISWAAHVPGGNITYECLGNNQYKIIFTLYEDCGEAFEGNGAQTIDITNDCGVGGLTSVSLNNTIFQENISQVCPAEAGNTDCNGFGAIQGVFRHRWEGIVTLPAGCDSWRFSYSSCCRGSLDNVVGTGSDYYFYAEVNNANAPCNSSPSFSAPPIPYACVGQTFCYNLGIVEPDGDDLTFSFVAPLVDATTGVPYSGTYSATNPYPGLTIDPNTGQINGVLNQAGNYVLAVQVNEYDGNGVLIGTTVQDFKMIVINCNNQAMDCNTSGTIGGIVGAVTQTGPTELEMCEGVAFSFDMSFTDPDIGDSTFIESNIASVLPGSIVTYSYPNAPNANVIAMTVSWTPPAGSSNSNNFFTVTVRDNSCPVVGQQTLVYNINVLGSTSVVGEVVGSGGGTGGTGSGPDNLIICEGQEVILSPVNGTVFNWNVILGDPISIGTNFSCNPCQNPIASPSVTTVYEVVSDLTGSCVNKDTITVTVVPNFTYTLTQSSTTSCIASDIQLEVIQNNAGTFTYDWSPITDLDNPTISNPVLTPSSPGLVEYVVSMESQDGCIHNDTIEVSVAGSYAPNVNITPSLNSVLCGEDVVFETDLGSGIPANCGISANNQCSGASVQTLGTGTTNLSTYPTPFGGFYEDVRLQMIFTATELQNMGFVGGKITELAFNVTNKVSTDPYNNFSISMGCTSATSFTLASGFVGGLTVVHTVAIHNSTAGWNNFVLNNAYEWDGISNLIVQVCFDNTDWDSNDGVAQSATTGNLSIYASEDDVSGCSMDLSGFVNGVSSNRPTVRFKTCPGTPDPTNYSFEWTDLSTSSVVSTIQNPTFTPIADTDYQLVVTDINGGCTDTVSSLITVSCGPAIPTVTNISCAGLTDGEINAAPGCNIFAPWEIELYDASMNLLSNSGIISSDFTFSNLPAGNYTISTVYQSGCIADTSVTIGAQTPMVLNVNNSDTLVCLGGTANIIATGVGGVLPYQYHWSNDLINTSNNNSFIVQNDSSIFVSVTDSQGCGSDTLEVNIFAMTTITTQAGTSKDTICSGESVLIFASSSGGYPTGNPSVGYYLYDWYNSNNVLIGSGNNLTVTPTQSPSIYYVHSYDNCETTVAIDTIVVHWYENLIPSFTADVLNGCVPVTVNFTNTTDPSITSQCFWMFGDGTTSANCGVQSHVFNGVGDFSVSLTVTSPNGCEGDTTYVNYIQTYGFPQAYFGIFPNPINLLEPTTTMYDSSSADVTSFQWNFGENGILGTSTVQNPTFTFPNSEPANFDVELIVTNQFGCSDTIVNVVIMNGIYNFYVPSAFTPNGDGVNDIFFAKGEGVSELEYEMIIFDRWGVVVFQSSEVSSTWDGTKMGDHVPPGVYVWKIRTKDQYLGTEYQHIGHVSVVR